MLLRLGSFLLVFSISLSLHAGDFEAKKFSNWHQWRGPLGTGCARGANPPVKWDEETNICWKVALPGRGSSTPIVWGDRIFLTYAIESVPEEGSVETPVDRPVDRPVKPVDLSPPEKESEKLQPNSQFSSLQVPTHSPSFRGNSHKFLMTTGAPKNKFKFVVLCLNRKTGEVEWEKTAITQVPHEGHHPHHGYASASPVTDGKQLYVSFGSRGIFCFDLDGNEKWSVDLGDMQTRMGFGEAASVAVDGDSLVVTWDHEGDSSLACLDTKSGHLNWRVDRDERTTWATPLIVHHQGTRHVVVNGSNRARSYDLKTGRVIWSCGGQTSNPIASPVSQEGVVFCMTGYKGYSVYALSLDGKNDLQGTPFVKWKSHESGPYVASPLLKSGFISFSHRCSRIDLRFL